MKNFYLTILLFFSISIVAQQRYVDNVFCDIEVTKDLEYTTQVLFTTVSLGFDTTQSQIPLKFDLYQPVGDNLEERPLVVFLHTGNFLDHPLGGVIGGTKTDSSAVEICTQLAQKGFVAVSAEYRRGWNPSFLAEQDRAKSIIRAAYRGIQDARTLNRFMRKEYENGNPYGIDTSSMIVFGQGTGGYVAFGCASIDSYDELLVGKFYTQDADGNAIEMVTEEVDGNIYGTESGINEDGTYITIGRYPGYSSDYHLGITLGGAIGDTSWVDENTIPMINVQTPEDAAAAFHQGVVVVSGDELDLNVVEVQGAYLVSELLNQYGVNEALGGSTMTDPYTTAALATSDLTYISPFNGIEYPVNNNYDGLLPLITEDWSNGDTNSSVWEWFDPNTNPNTPDGITETMAEIKEKALIYMDTIFGYSMPRVIHLLDLDSDLASSLDVSSTALEFGSAEVGDTRELEVTITNPYDEVLDFTSDAAAPFSVSGATAIEACGTTTLTFTFVPEADGAVEEVVTLSSSSGDLTFNLSGNGTAQPIVSFGINGQGIEFEDVSFDIVDSQMTVSVNNTGTVDLQITSIFFNGDDVFTTDGVPQPLPVGESVDIVVNFTPLEQIAYAGSLVVETDQAGSLEVPLIGDGVWTVGVEDAIANSINVYPNPSNGQFNIDLGALSGQKVELTVFDNTGRMMVEQTLNDNRVSIDGLNAGVYFVSIKTTEGIVTKKVLVQ